MCDLFVSIVWFNEDYELLDKLLNNLIQKSENKITIGVCLSCNKHSIDKIVTDYADQNVKFIPLPKEVSRYSYGRYLTQQMITNEKYYVHFSNVLSVCDNWDTKLKSLIIDENTILCHCKGFPYVKKTMCYGKLKLPLIAINEQKDSSHIYLDNIVVANTKIIRNVSHKTTINLYGVNEILSIEHYKYKHNIEYVNFSDIFHIDDELSIPPIPDTVQPELENIINEHSNIYNEIFTKSDKKYQIILEFHKFILKKIDSKSWIVTTDDKDVDFEEVGNDYKSHTLKNSELMIRVMRNGEAVYDYLNNNRIASNGNVMYDSCFVPIINESKSITDVVNKGIGKIIVNNSESDDYFNLLTEKKKYDIKYIKNIKFPVDELRATLDTHQKFMYLNSNVFFVGKLIASLQKIWNLLNKYDVVYSKCRGDIKILLCKDSQTARYMFSKENIEEAFINNPKIYHHECCQYVPNENLISMNDKKCFAFCEDGPKFKEKLSSFKKLSLRRLKC